MWLRNYYNLLSSLSFGDTTLTSSAQPTDYTPPIRVRNMEGTWQTPRLENVGTETNYDSLIKTLMTLGKGRAFIATSTGLASWPGVGLFFSTDNTPVAYDDYTMTGIITSGLTLASAAGTIADSSVYDSETHEYSSSHSYIITNSTSSPITISSIGLFCFSWLVYREVLETPMTLNQAESIVIRFDRKGEIYNYQPYPT